MTDLKPIREALLKLSGKRPKFPILDNVDIEQIAEKALAHLNAIDSAPNKWQPIETAPKDGQPILTATSGEGQTSIEINEWFKTEREDYHLQDNGLYKLELRIFAEGWNNNGHRATHWMPLPAEPR